VMIAIAVGLMEVQIVEVMMAVIVGAIVAPLDQPLVHQLHLRVALSFNIAPILQPISKLKLKMAHKAMCNFPTMVGQSLVRGG